MSDSELLEIRKMIRRVARAVPSLSAEDIAHRVGCSVDEVHRELEEVASRRLAQSQTTGTVASPLAAMAESANANIRSDAAADPDCPVPLLRRLADDDSPWVRAAVAAHPSCPSNILVHLAADSEPAVRQLVAYHKSSPPAALAGLASDSDTLVCLAVASNASCPLAVLRQLHKDAGLRLTVAQNPNWSP